MPNFTSQPMDENIRILNLMKESKIYWQVKRQLISGMTKSEQGSMSKSSTWQPSLQQLLKTLLSSDNEDKITGLITNCLQKSTRRLPIEQDTSPQIQVLRQKWSQMISKEFNNIANRIIKNEEYDQEDESVNYTYDSSSFLEFMASMKNKSLVVTRDSPIFLFPSDVVKTANYQQIRNKFAFLTAGENLIGDGRDADLKDRERKAARIVDGENIASEIETYLSYGSVSTQRVNVYTRYFECFYEYTGKRVDFSLYEKVWKSIIRLDCKEILKDPQYFVFKEELYKVYKLFVCDKQLGQMLKLRQLSSTAQLDKYSPIHHVLPCKGFATYMAPFCYASISSEQIYELFRQIYCNFLINLHVISSQTDGILGLCILFQQLLYTTQKKIVLKFQTLNIHPLRIVFPWIFYCLIGYIHIEQFFLLLDRIIGMKSLEILPLYCVSVLFKCKTQILEAKSEAQVIQILVDQMREDVWVETVREFFKYHL